MSTVASWTKYRKIVDIIKQRKLQLFGHICHMPDKRLIKTIMLGMVDGDRHRGRPPRRWVDDIVVWSSIAGSGVADGRQIRVASTAHKGHELRRRRRLVPKVEGGRLKNILYCLKNVVYQIRVKHTTDRYSFSGFCFGQRLTQLTHFDENFSHDIRGSVNSMRRKIIYLFVKHSLLKAM